MKHVLSAIAVIVFSFPTAHGGQEITAAVDNDVFIDANNIMMFVTNQGFIGRDLDFVFGYEYGTFYPYTDTAAIRSGAAINSPLFSASLWIGGIDSATADTLLAVCEYSTEYRPGSMTYLPGQWDDPQFRVYKLHSDSLEANPNADYTAWPEVQGAPVGLSGRPNMIGDQMLWAVYNDSDPSRHDVEAGNTAPLGVEIRQTVFAYDRLGALGDAIFIRYRVYNRGQNIIDPCYFSFWADPDLGDREDDYVGCDTTNDLGYIYNSDNDDYYYGATPPCLGFDLLQGPLALNTPADTTASGDPLTGTAWNTTFPGYHNLRMTSFRYYINGVDPASAAETYNYMRGFDRTGEPYVYGTDTLAYMRTGNPVLGTGDVDTAPTDRKWFQTSGPIAFRPGDSTEIILALVVGQGSDRLNSITAMKNNDATVQSFYESGQMIPTDAGGSTPPALPDKAVLQQNYPNPFNAATAIAFTLARAGRAELKIYNLLGQEVAVPLSASLSAGEHRVTWDGKDKNGRTVPSGIYLYRLKTDDISETRKMILMK